MYCEMIKLARVFATVVGMTLVLLFSSLFKHFVYENVS